MYNPVTGDIKIVDFEIAKNKKYNSDQLSMWTNTGTLHYKAPEMFEGEYDEKIDIWAIGVIAFELLTGQLPFDGNYHRSVVAKILSKNPFDSVESNIGSPEKKLLEKFLEKDPSKRIDLKDALKSPFLLQNSFESKKGKSKKLRRAETMNYDGKEDKENLKEPITVKCYD